MNKALLELKRECENYQILDSVSVLALKAMNLLTEMERYLEEQREQGRQDETEEEILQLFFALRSFLNIHDLLDKNYVIYSEMQSDGKFMVKLFCVNPAENLQNCLEQGNSTIFFLLRCCRYNIINLCYLWIRTIMQSMQNRLSLQRIGEYC